MEYLRQVEMTLCIGILLLTLFTFTTSASEAKEICRWESMNATCGPDHVVLMTTARYGRMQLGRCLSRDYYIGCAGDVIRHADMRCSGRHECIIKVPDETLHEVQPCPKDIMAYLEADYTCVKVATGEDQTCQAYRPIVIGGPTGYIANSITEEKGYGTNYCPWLIKVGAGQRINITIYDFETLHHNQESAICQVYASIKERTRTRDVTVCASGERVKHVMLSDTNEVEVNIIPHGAQTQKPYFLLKYEALGCPDPRPPAYGWAQRNGDSLVVGCNDTALKWHLVCKDGKWYGEIKNCTKVGGSWNLGRALGDEGVPYGLLISVAIGVLLGILLGSCMLVMVLWCRRWRTRVVQRNAAALLKGGVQQGHMPPPLPADRMYISDKHTGTGITDPRGAKDNNGGYAHIWELRQGMPGSEDMSYDTSKRSNMSDPGYYSSQGTGYDRQTSRTSASTTRPRDHVYESPKSIRRQDGIYQAGEGGPYYHEFDPSMADPNDHEMGQKRADDVINRNTMDCSVSLHDD